MLITSLKAVLAILILLMLVNPTVAAPHKTIRADQELDALQNYLTYYRVGHNSITAFGNWYHAAPTDIAYIRTVCNTVAVGALYKAKRPNDTAVDVSWARLRDMFMAVMNEYNSWGYTGLPENQHLGDHVGMAGYPCTLAAALMWEQVKSDGNPVLSAGDKATISTNLKDLASRIYAVRNTTWWDARQGNCGDSKVEEVASDAAFLAAISQFYRSYTVGYITWSERAQLLMAWVFNNLNEQNHCPAPSVNYDYDYTVTNHNMYPHPNYGLSISDNIARAILPWSAQGITLQTNPVYDITDLNEKLYGGSADNFLNLYNANVEYVELSDFTLKGSVYDTSQNLSVSKDLESLSYLEVAGAGEWAMSARFQNSSFAFGSWLYATYYNSSSEVDLQNNYTDLLDFQEASSGYAYLPTVHSQGCTGGAQLTPTYWHWGYLTSTCSSSLWGTLVHFFWPVDLNLARQVNTHLFLNSFKAFNHLVSYMYTRSKPYWPVDDYGNSTLPDFGGGQVVWGAQDDKPVPGDYDGDDRLDYAVWRPSNGTWYMRFAKQGLVRDVQWGANGGKLVPGDYDGDGRTDYAVWRPSDGRWWIKYSDSGWTCDYQWGSSSRGDIPVPADYNNDGVTDFAVWRPYRNPNNNPPATDGSWYITYKQKNQRCDSVSGHLCKCRTMGTSSLQWGAAEDKPVPGDFNGDEITDYAVWRPSTSVWWIRYSNGASCSYQWGSSSRGDIPVPADYNNDGVTDFAVWRPYRNPNNNPPAIDGSWYVRLKSKSTSCTSIGTLPFVQWGTEGDVPLPGDYGANNLVDYVVWRPSTATWWVKSR